MPRMLSYCHAESIYSIVMKMSSSSRHVVSTFGSRHVRYDESPSNSKRARLTKVGRERRDGGRKGRGRIVRIHRRFDRKAKIKAPSLAILFPVDVDNSRRALRRRDTGKSAQYESPQQRPRHRIARSPISNVFRRRFFDVYRAAAAATAAKDKYLPAIMLT